MKSTFKLCSLVFIFFLAFLHLDCESKTVLKGAISTVIKKGNVIRVSLNTPVNFYYSAVGDKVAAFLQEDIVISDELFIPKGSRLEGIITNIKKPRRLGLSGAFEIDFNEIVTKDNIRIPVYASVSTDTTKAEEKVADILSYDTALVAYGTFHGAIAGVQYGGVPLAIASHGISVLAGAGVGATFGVIGSLIRKGEIPQASVYIPTKVALKSDLHIFGEIPRIKETEKQEAEKQRSKEKEYVGFRFYPSVKREDVEIRIINVKNEHSKFYGDYIVLNFKLKNNSNKTISLSDFVLVGATRRVAPTEVLHPDLFLSGTESLKSVKPFDEIDASLAFIITKKINDYCLALVDPLDRKEIVRIPLNEE